MLAANRIAIRAATGGLRRTAARSAVQVRAWSSIKDDHQYSAKATSYGSRAGGTVKLDDGSLELKMSLPKALGGPGGKAHNPEELFALGYANCFASALGAVYKQKFGTKTGKALTEDAQVKCEVFIGNATDESGFKLAVHLKVPFDSLESSKLSKEDAQTLIEEAHKLCPYSRATKGNIESKVELV